MSVVQSSDMTAVATEVVDAFGMGDWRRFRATLHRDVIYEETGTQRRVEGADAYVRLCQGWKEAFPDGRATGRRTVADGQTVAQEVHSHLDILALLQQVGALPATNT